MRALTLFGITRPLRCCTRAVGVRAISGDGPDAVLDAPLGGLDHPTSITDAVTGAIIRA